MLDHGLEVVGVAAAVCSADDVANLVVGAAVEQHSRTDVLVNNARHSGVTAEIPGELWYDAIHTNFNSAFLAARPADATCRAGGMRACSRSADDEMPSRRSAKTSLGVSIAAQAINACGRPGQRLHHH